MLLVYRKKLVLKVINKQTKKKKEKKKRAILFQIVHFYSQKILIVKCNIIYIYITFSIDIVQKNISLNIIYTCALCIIIRNFEMLCVHSKKLTFNNTYVQVILQCYVKYKDVLFINVYVKNRKLKKCLKSVYFRYYFFFFLIQT